MSTLHIFCPWHEEALAAASPHFTPTQAAQQMADSLCTLPAWWAEPGDVVWVPDMPLSFNSEKISGITFTTRPDFTHITSVDAWGRSAALRQRLKRAGCPERLLPSEELLQKVRTCSSRRFTTLLLGKLQASGVGTAFRSWWCESEQEVQHVMAAHRGPFVAKAPWSGSGRGVFRFDAQQPASGARLRSILRKQGGIELEPLYERLADGAMEFRLTDGTAEFVGLSLFSTNEAGAYTGSVVADDPVLQGMFCATAEKFARGSSEDIIRALTTARTALTRLLPEVFSGIEGYVGVDMMLVRLPDGSIALHPCVEINLRRTMGLAAILMRRHLPDHCREGHFCVRPAGCHTEKEMPSLRLTPQGMPFEACLYF